MPESFIATVQKLRRVVIPPNVFEVIGLKEGDKVRVTVELVSSVQIQEEKKQWSENVAITWRVAQVYSAVQTAN